MRVRHLTRVRPYQEPRLTRDDFWPGVRLFVAMFGLPMLADSLSVWLR